MKHFLFLFPVLFILGCTTTGSQGGYSRDLYQDKYDENSSLYTNKDLGLSLAYNDNWNIYAATKKMPKAISQQFNFPPDTKAELIFFGLTLDNMQGTRCIVEPANMDPMEYYKLIKKITASQIAKDFEEQQTKINGINTIVWNYEANASGYSFHYVDYQIKKDVYNIRFSFWTTTDLFEENKKNYEKIISTLKFIEE